MKEQLQRLKLSPTDLLVPRRPPGLRSVTPTYLDPAVFFRFFVGHGPQSARPVFAGVIVRQPNSSYRASLPACRASYTPIQDTGKRLSCDTTLTTSQDVESDVLAPAPLQCHTPSPQLDSLPRSTIYQIRKTGYVGRRHIIRLTVLVGRWTGSHDSRQSVMLFCIPLAWHCKAPRFSHGVCLVSAKTRNLPR